MTVFGGVLVWGPRAMCYLLGRARLTVGVYLLGVALGRVVVLLEVEVCVPGGLYWDAGRVALCLLGLFLCKGWVLVVTVPSLLALFWKLYGVVLCGVRVKCFPVFLET